MRNLVSMMSATPQYGIGVAKNRFELFDAEDEDPLELLKQREKEREERRKAKLAEKENKSKQQVPPSKSKVQKVLKETQKTKAPVEIQKPKEDKKVKIRRDADGEERGFNTHEKREYSNERKWFDNEANNAQENGVNNDRDRRDLRDNLSGNGFQRGGRGGRRGLPRGVFVRGGGGRGAARGGFQRNFDNRGKREYDRQSGSDKTGVKPIDKREGSGAHNWGNAQDDWNNQQHDEWNNQQDDWNNQQDDWTTPSQDTNNLDKSPKAEEGAPVSEGEQPPEPIVDASATPKDDEPGTVTEGGLDDKPEMTLDEWKALKQPRNQPSFNIRKPGEGEDLTRWKKMYALNKKKEDEEDTDDEEYEYGEYPQRVGRQRRILDINIKFKDARGGSGERGRGGRGFGGRGGPRGGGRGSGFAREPVQERPGPRDRDLPPAPKVDDEKDFPSLA